MPVVLPLELHELIIDQLLYSFLELKACSIVCKAWLPRCRLHLFRTLIVRPRIFNKGYSEPFCCEYQQFFTLDHSFITPSIVFHVRRLKLSYEVQTPFGLLPDSSCAPISSALIPVSSMITIPFPFKRLQTLHICWRSVNWGGVTALEKMLQQIDCLRHLVIEGRWRFRVKEDILSSIALHAPGLKTLCLAKLQWFPNSIASPFVEEILSRRNDRFYEQGVPPLRLERLCITKSTSKNCVADLEKVILPSPCLDLSNLRYLAMPAGSLQEVIHDARFRTLGRQVTHLAIVNLDTSAFKVDSGSFPVLSHLQLYIRKEHDLVQFLHIHGASATSTPPWVRMHINFEKHLNHRLKNREMTAQSYSDIIVHTPSVDLALHKFIVDCEVSMQISVHFAHLHGGEPDIQHDYIQEMFPQSFSTGHLEWTDRKSLEWWFDHN
ncbi:hypothetical protein F5051DRAFT_406208 [Lentinula edodes]|nr:hypothetical protein F5051DRAFT_406208 [Lentinula edodes]